VTPQDWATIAALVTAGCTLVLAFATFASVRSANRSARTAERALLVGIRPLLFPSHLQDAEQKVFWYDQHLAVLGGGRASAEATDAAVYLAMSLRNVGSGIAVLDGWYPWPDRSVMPRDHEPPHRFRRLTRDLYIAQGNMSFWQGALREPAEEVFTQMRASIDARMLMGIDLLYGDHEGGQRVISRFSIVPAEDGGCLCTVARHWNLDRADPR